MQRRARKSGSFMICRLVKREESARRRSAGCSRYAPVPAAVLQRRCTPTPTSCMTRPPWYRSCILHTQPSPIMRHHRPCPSRVPSNTQLHSAPHHTARTSWSTVVPLHGLRPATVPALLVPCCVAPPRAPHRPTGQVQATRCHWIHTHTRGAAADTGTRPHFGAVPLQQARTHPLQ